MKNQVASRQRTVGVGKRRKLRAVDHAGEQSGFLQFQISDRLAEIKFGGGGEAVISVRQVYLIGVHRKNLRLGIAALDLQCQQHFLHLAAETAVAAIEEKIAGELHTDGARASSDAALGKIAKCGAGDAREVNAPVFLEMLIFDGGHRVVENLGTLLIGHQDAALQSEATHELAVVGVNFSDHVGTVGFKRANLRQIAGVDKEQAAACAQRNRAQQQKCERNTVDQFPAAQPQRNRGKAQHESGILQQICCHKRMHTILFLWAPSASYEIHFIRTLSTFHFPSLKAIVKTSPAAHSPPQ